jgi:hypothetical protein
VLGMLRRQAHDKGRHERDGHKRQRRRHSADVEQNALRAAHASPGAVEPRNNICVGLTPPSGL